MTRQRKEIQKKMWELEREECAEYELGCGFFSQEIAEAFRPHWEKLEELWCATYGRTRQEQMDYVFERQNEAYDNGRIPYTPCWGAI
jgi:hypothetical protein